MSKYSDAEKAAYWKSKALGTTPVPRTTVTRRVVAKAAAPPKAVVRAAPRKVAVRVAPQAAKPVAVKQLSSKAEGSTSFGHKVGSTLGGMIGHGIQNVITKLTGFGDYTVEENSIFKGGIGIMEVKNTTAHGGVIVRHREYVGPVVATEVFTNTVYPLNPGLSGTFPWLSQPANAYEQWRLRGAVVEFVSTSSDAVLSTNTSSSLGKVMIATQYDSIEPPFSSSSVMLNHEFSNSRKPSEDFLHPIECKSSLTAQQLYYIRNGAMPPSSDERFYDLGLLQVATEGMQAVGGNVGDLYIVYEVEFYKPRISPGAPVGAVLSDHFRLTSWTNALPLGTPGNPTSTSSLKGKIISGTQYRFPPEIQVGNYLITIVWTGTSASFTAPTVTPVNATQLGLWQNGTSFWTQGPANGVATGTVQFTFILSLSALTGTQAGFNLSATGAYPVVAATGSDMFITQIDTDLINLERKRKKKKGKWSIMPGDTYPLKIENSPSPTPMPDDDESSSSEEYVRIKKSDVKRKSLSILSDRSDATSRY